MKKLFYLLLAGAFAFTSCDKDDTDPVAVERITLDQTELMLKRSQNATLTATVLPDDANYPTVGWTSSDPSVATVSDAGTVTAVKPGTTTITAEAGGLSAACAVTVEPDVYVIGYNGEVTDYLSLTAYLWKNGEATQIPINLPTSLFISEGDVYVTGAYKDETMKYSTCAMWKNGTLTLYQQSNSSGESIFVSDGNVYIAGHASANVAYLWTNGVRELVGGGQVRASAARSVFISDGDVYVGGNHYAQEAPNRSAVYWKNGKAIYLTDGTSYAGINSIVVAEGVVYAAGYDYAGSKSVVWIDGVPTYQEGASSAFSIRVSDKGDVYVAASISNGAPTIWKNGEPIRLSEQKGRAESIFLYGEDVYVAGYLGTTAVMWKNGVPTELPEGNKAVDIFVY